MLKALHVNLTQKGEKRKRLRLTDGDRTDRGEAPREKTDDGINQTVTIAAGPAAAGAPVGVAGTFSAGSGAPLAWGSTTAGYGDVSLEGGGAPVGGAGAM